MYMYTKFVLKQVCVQPSYMKVVCQESDLLYMYYTVFVEGGIVSQSTRVYSCHVRESSAGQPSPVMNCARGRGAKRPGCLR